ENLPGFTNLRKTTCQGGFFVSKARDYPQRKTISRRSSVIFDRYGIKVSNARSIWGVAAAFTTVESSYFHGKK
ncbi:hypothetical protein SMA73_24905, partial [Escherichia coli]